MRFDRALRWIIRIAFAVVCGSGQNAFAETATSATVAPVPTEAPRPLSFSADHLELDPKLERLELRGNVVVTVDRYRLTSDRLTMDRTPRGISVEGAGRVAACPCPNPPVTFGFEAALVAPPTDLLLTQPTVRLYGVPVLWLPYLWFRAPSRVGLLPLIVAWRGKDGFLAGSGVHVPVHGGALDISAAGYFRGGVDLGAQLVTERTATKVRWDYVDESLVAVDLRGAAVAEGGASVVWSADALRGPRALSGPVLLEEAALRQDRAQVTVGASNGIVTAGVYGTAAAPRGASVDSFGVVGPGAYAGIGSALGPFALADLDVGVTTLRGPDATSTFASQHAELRLDGRAGPVALSLSGRTRAIATLEERASGYAAAAGFAADATMPLVKEYGSQDAPLQHWITPFASVIGGSADTRSPSIAPNIAGNGVFYAGSTGVRSTVGEVASGRGAFSVSARGAYLGEGSHAPRPALAVDASGRARSLAVQFQGIAMEAAHLTLTEVRLGSERGLFIGGRIFGRDGDVPLIARLLEGGWDAPWVPWLSVTGWSAGGSVGVPWTSWLYTVAGADYDWTSRTLLGVRGNIGYRHPCGCLAVSLWAGRRAGRNGPQAPQGVDSWLAVDLAP